MRRMTSIVLSLLFVFALAACGGGSESGEQILGHDVQTAVVMNGPKTKAIGTYAFIEMGRSELDGLSDEQWVEIFGKVEEMDYNYFSIFCEDGTGACFPGCSFMASVGEIDETGSIGKTEKELMCPDGKLTITQADSGA